MLMLLPHAHAHPLSLASSLLTCTMSLSFLVNPAKLADLPAMLERNKGSEAQLLEDIKKKYWSLKFEDFAETEDSKNEEENEDKEGWVKLGDICNTRGGIKFKLEIQPSSIISKYIYLRGQNLNNIILNNKDFVYLNYYDKKFETYKINKSDLYYVLVGSVGLCGESSIEAYMSGNICSIYNIDINMSKKYIMYYLIFNKPKFNKNAQPNISRETLLNILIPNLSLSKQEKIVEYLDEKFKTYKIEETLELFKE
jgi:restriction endonuclease S subunit